MTQLTYYDILGVEHTASAADIKAAFRRASVANHPDTVNAQDKYAAKRFTAINKAYKVLTDPATRKKYDTSQRQKTKNKGSRETLKDPMLERFNKINKIVEELQRKNPELYKVKLAHQRRTRRRPFS